MQHPSNDYYVRQRDKAEATARRYGQENVLLWVLLGIAVFTNWDESVRDWLIGAWSYLTGLI